MISCKGKRAVGKSNKGVNEEKVDWVYKIKIIKKITGKKMEQERKKKNSTELQKPNIDAEVYNNNKNCH